MFSFCTYAQGWIQKSDGIYGGEITSFVKKDDLMLASTKGARIFISKDNGLNWKLSSDGIAGKNITSLATNGTLLFAGSFSDGVYISNNDGLSWHSAITGLGNLQVVCLLPYNESVIAGTVSGLYLYNLTTKTWSGLNNGLPAHGPYKSPWVSNLFAKDDILIAGTFGTGAYISFNNGASWTIINDIPNNTFVRSSIDKDGLFYLGTNLGLYTSMDNGLHWTATGTGLAPNHSVDCLSTKEDKMYAGTGNGLYQSIDNGTSWSKIILNGYWQQDLVNSLLATESGIFAGTEHDIYYSSDDGVSWNLRSGGIVANFVNQIVAYQNNLFAATANGLYRSSDKADHWESINTDEHRIFATMALGDSLLGQGFYNTFFSVDKGSTWDFFPLTGTNYPPRLLNVHNGNIYGSSNDGLFVFPKNGTQWLNLNLENYSNVNNMVVIGDTLVAGTANSKLFLSTNKGTSWQTITNGLPSFFVVNSMTTHNGKIFLIDYSGIIYESSDRGLSWIKLNSTNPPFAEKITAVNNYLMVGSVGAYFSPDVGFSWISLKEGRTSNVDFRSFVSDNDVVYAGTQEGVWVRSLNNLAPVITSFSPSSGIAGTEVIISGNNFSAVASLNAVTLVETPIVSSDATSTSIKITIPKDAISGKFTIKINGRTVQSNESFTVCPDQPIVTATDLPGALIKLSSNSTTGNQWLLNDNVIEGAVQQTYEPNTYGKYTVQVTKNGCTSKASEAYNYTITGLDKFTFSIKDIYPVPSSDEVFINLNGSSENSIIQIRLLDIYGRMVKQYDQAGGKTVAIQLESIPEGIYFVTIIQNEHFQSFKIIKNQGSLR